jgi:hypothetical protein
MRRRRSIFGQRKSSDYWTIIAKKTLQRQKESLNRTDDDNSTPVVHEIANNNGSNQLQAAK